MRTIYVRLDDDSEAPMDDATKQWLNPQLAAAGEKSSTKGSLLLG
jgi:hypothetical protein